MRGLLMSLVGRSSEGLTNRYLTLEAEGMKRAAESAWGPSARGPFEPGVP